MIYFELRSTDVTDDVVLGRDMTRDGALRKAHKKARATDEAVLVVKVERGIHTTIKTVKPSEGET